VWTRVIRGQYVGVAATDWVKNLGSWNEHQHEPEGGGGAGAEAVAGKKSSSVATHADASDLNPLRNDMARSEI
jgi:hypothetical protein